jgi:hypothetical protein
VSDEDIVKIASVSGQGSGSVVAGLLRSAFDCGRLCQMRRLDRGDQRRWIEFRYHSRDGSSEAVMIALDNKHDVVGGELWRSTADSPWSDCARSTSTTYENIDRLTRSLRCVHSVDRVREAVVAADGELVAISFEFSEGTRFLLARH